MQNALSYFSGRDGFQWFIGVCEDRDDPKGLGRVRVRVFGYHTEILHELPTQDLPWAPVILPPTANPGELPNITPGQWVFGFWRDPDYYQEPIILGILPGHPAQGADPSKGFSDPNSPDAPETQDEKYRKEPDYGPYPTRTGEPDTNRLVVANNDKPHPLVESVREQERGGDAESDPLGYLNIPTSDGQRWSEPPYPYQSSYPYNHVHESESGHVREIDDTPDHERIHERHRTGTYYEIDAGGNKVTKVVGDEYELVAGSNYIYVKGNVNLTVDSNLNTYVKGNYNMLVDGDMDIRVKGHLRETIDQSVTEIYQSTKDETVTGKVTEVYKDSQQTSVTGVRDLDATDEIDCDAGIINLN